MLSLPDKEDIRFQVRARLARQYIQHYAVGNQLRLIGILLQRGGERGLSLGQATQVQLCDSLAGNRERGGRARCGGEFFVDVEGSLILLSSLDGSLSDDLYPFFMNSTYNSHSNPGLGDVYEQRVLRPALGSLDFFDGEIGAVLLEVDLDNQGDTI